MSCERWTGSIALFVEGDLAEPEAGGVAAHLLDCEACQKVAAELERSQQALKELRTEPVDPEMLDAVRRRVMLAAAAREQRDWWGAWWWKPAAVAAVALAMVAVLWRGEPKVAAPAVLTARIVTPELVAREERLPAKRAAKADRPKAVPANVVAAKTTDTEPLVVQIQTDDPDVVIYWLIDEPGPKGD